MTLSSIADLFSSEKAEQHFIEVQRGTRPPRTECKGTYLHPLYRTSARILDQSEPYNLWLDSIESQRHFGDSQITAPEGVFNPESPYFLRLDAVRAYGAFHYTPERIQQHVEERVRKFMHKELEDDPAVDERWVFDYVASRSGHKPDDLDYRDITRFLAAKREPSQEDLQAAKKYVVNRLVLRSKNLVGE